MNQQVYYLMFLKHMKDVYLIKWNSILTTYFLWFWKELQLAALSNCNYRKVA